MKRAGWARWVFLLSFVLRPPGGTGSLPDRSSSCLKVMSFNMRYGTADDGENRWENRRNLINDVLREEAPDIIGLQEALRFQIDFLRAEFPLYREIGVGRDDGESRGEYAAILYRDAALGLISQGTFWFSDTPDQPGSKSWGNSITRICTWAVFQVRATGDTIAVYNVHLDHESAPSRVRSARLLMDTVALGKGRRTIVMGDFNEGEDQPAVTMIRKNGLVDSYRILHPSDSLVQTYHAFEGNTKGPKIDYIFVDSLLTVQRAQIVRTHRLKRYPSDHYPVSATVCAKEKS